MKGIKKERQARALERFESELKLWLSERDSLTKVGKKSLVVEQKIKIKIRDIANTKRNLNLS